jgi:hypothetical protein
MIVLDATAPTWAQRFAEDVKRAFEGLRQSPIPLARYADAATLNARAPPARFAGALAYLDSTARPVFSDGSAWRYVHDNSAV